MTHHELLAPAGSLEICRAVLAAGADAVYLGGEKYGARAFAKNFTRNDILEALDYAHLYGRKIFLTVNTLLKNREIERELYDYLEPFYLHGLDAIIVQDYGVFQFVRRNFPELPVHASTQMSVSNVYGAEFLKKRGASRIVTARELSLGEIRDIYEQTGVEIESFIHGALCYCYSGQCLMSSMLGGRSGNRGRCAQPCRLAYQVLDDRENVLRRKEKYPLSPKDLCTVTLLPKLCEAGIYSFKIEGRMKQMEYAAGVTSVYRKYLDLYEQDPKSYRVEDRDIDYLLQLGNRNGFTKGYYEMRNGREMMTLTDSSHSSGQAKEVYRQQKMEKIPINGRLKLEIGKPAYLAVEAAGQKKIPDRESMPDRENMTGTGLERAQNTDADGVERAGMEWIGMEGAIVQEAQSRPLTEKDVEERIKKTGETPFSFENLDIVLDDRSFFPVKQLNDLRRNALLGLQGKITEKYRRNPSGQGMVLPEKKTKVQGESGRTFLNVCISSPQMLSEVVRYPFVDMITLDFTEQLESCLAKIHASGKMAGVFFPFVFRKNSVQQFQNMQAVLRKFERVWVRSYDSLGYTRDTLGIKAEQIALDHNLYVYSEETAEAFAADGLEHYTVSLELNQKELGHMPNREGEFLLYGYAPLMVSAQCIYKNYDQCYKNRSGKDKNLYLKDRYFKKFFIKRNCKDCYNIIYNSQPISLFHHADGIRKLGFGSYRIAFVSENKEQIQNILHTFENAFRKGRTVKAPEEKDSFTNGHFRRGVE